ncbi:MAG TPA: hypothetical protein VF766_15180, partial [Pyrinomonadaceae bacterium]
MSKIKEESESYFEIPGAQAKGQLPDLVCLSHLRWDFVYQRPQHLLSRFACERRVFFVEEPSYTDGPMRLDVSARECGVQVVVPYLPQELAGKEELDGV